MSTRNPGQRVKVEVNVPTGSLDTDTTSSKKKPVRLGGGDFVGVYLLRLHLQKDRNEGELESVG